MNFARIPYDHFGTALLVSGERDEYECTVDRVTAADSNVDLFDMLPPSTIQTIADRVDRQLSAEARKSKAEMWAEADKWMRDLAQLSATF